MLEFCLPFLLCWSSVFPFCYVNLNPPNKETRWCYHHQVTISRVGQSSFSHGRWRVPSNLQTRALGHFTFGRQRRANHTTNHARLQLDAVGRSRYKVFAPKVQGFTITTLEAIRFLLSPAPLRFQNLIQSCIVLTLSGPKVQLAGSLILDGPSACCWPTLASNVCTANKNCWHILEGVLFLTWIRLDALRHFLWRVPFNAQSCAFGHWIVIVCVWRTGWLGQWEVPNQAPYNWVAAVKHVELLIVQEVLAQEEQFLTEGCHLWRQVISNSFLQLYWHMDPEEEFRKKSSHIPLSTGALIISTGNWSHQQHVALPRLLALTGLEALRWLQHPSTLGQHLIKGQHSCLSFHQPHLKRLAQQGEGLDQIKPWPSGRVIAVMIPTHCGNEEPFVAISNEVMSPAAIWPWKTWGKCCQAT